MLRSLCLLFPHLLPLLLLGMSLQQQLGLAVGAGTRAVVGVGK